MTLILTPLAIEKRKLAAHLSPSPNFVLRVGGHGKVAMALATHAAILEFKPDLVILAGTAGSLSPLVSPFDVVIATSTIEHDFKLRFLKRPLPEFFGDAPSIAKLRGVQGVHFGKMASGDEDVIEAARAAELAQATSALAVAWEGAGAARACAFAKVPFLEVRGVTDLADENAIADFEKLLEPAMKNIARALSILVG